MSDYIICYYHDIDYEVYCDTKAFIWIIFLIIEHYFYHKCQSILRSIIYSILFP